LIAGENENILSKTRRIFPNIPFGRQTGGSMAGSGLRLHAGSRPLGYSAIALVLSVLAMTASVATSAAAQRRGEDYTAWSMYGGTSDSLQYSSLKQIDRSNVSRLQVAWTYDMGDSLSIAAPVVVDGVMYIPGPEDSIVAVDTAASRCTPAA
jgi:glucose dehydrogenase